MLIRALLLNMDEWYGHLMNIRKIHRTLAWVTAVPLLLIFTTGACLQMKSWLPWVEPKTEKGSSTVPLIHFTTLLEAARSVPLAKVHEWKDIRAVDVRPGKGIANIRTYSEYQITVDLGTGLVTHAQPRYTSLLIQLHEGSFFGESVRYGIFFPTALLALLLCITGIRLLIRFKPGRKVGMTSASKPV